MSCMLRLWCRGQPCVRPRPTIVKTFSRHLWCVLLVLRTIMAHLHSCPLIMLLTKTCYKKCTFKGAFRLDVAWPHARLRGVFCCLSDPIFWVPPK